MLEYISCWLMGDVLVFFDFIFVDDGLIVVYGEIMLCLLLGYLFDFDFGVGLICDVYFIVNFECGKQGLE